MPKKHYKLTKKKVTAAILKHRGILKYAADACGVSRQSMYEFLEYYPDLWKVVEEARDTLIDEVEQEMLSVIFSTDPQAINQKANLMKFFLSNQAKHRGYNTEKEEKKEQGPIVISLEGFPRPPDVDS